MKTLLELRKAVAKRVWRLASGYPPPPPPPEVPRDKQALPRERWEFHPMLAGADHPRRWGFPAYLDHPGTAWLQTLKRLYGSPLSFPASLSPEAGLLVHALLRNLRPRTVVETGTWVGISTIWMASALEANGAGELHTFDEFLPIRKDMWREEELVGGRVEYVRARLAEAGLAGRVRIHQGNSSYEIRRMHEELRAAGGVQVALIDGDHGVEGTCQDFWAVEPVLATGGYVLLHDIYPEYCGGHEGPRHLAERVNALGVGVYEKCEVALSPVNYGIALLRRVG